MNKSNGITCFLFVAVIAWASVFVCGDFNPVKHTIQDGLLEEQAREISSLISDGVSYDEALVIENFAFQNDQAELRLVVFTSIMREIRDGNIIASPNAMALLLEVEENIVPPIIYDDQFVTADEWSIPLNGDAPASQAGYFVEIEVCRGDRPSNKYSKGLIRIADANILSAYEDFIRLACNDQSGWLMAFNESGREGTSPCKNELYPVRINKRGAYPRRYATPDGGIPRGFSVCDIYTIPGWVPGLGPVNTPLPKHTCECKVTRPIYP